jgi:hypothetical protein
MKFIYADSMDFVDPGYNFLSDRNAEGRNPYWDDLYPHEILGYAPYDGILVSRGIVGDHQVSGKYTEAQAMRFRRVGARRFLRLDIPQYADLAIFGDCGAFTYHKEPEPPYAPEEMVEFYDDAGFTHGCSVDHIIFDFDEGVKTGLEGGSGEARRRFDITLANAADFLSAATRLSNRFTPLGVIQGWSPGSMGEAAKRLVKMGYRYLAIGGTVPLKAPQIKACLRAIRSQIPPDIALHILGFAKADEIETFVPFQIASFDSTSPLIRAFKDNKSNYYLRREDGRLDYYTAIRIPQALENTKLLHLVKQGTFRQEDLMMLERRALDMVRAYDVGEAGLDETLEAALAYGTPAILGMPIDQVARSKALEALRTRYHRTLSEQPWKRCSCAICQAISVEVIIFRASNRNKRRGIHNLGVFKTLVDNLPHPDVKHGQTDLFGDPCPTEPDAHGADVCDDSDRSAAVCQH